MVNSLFPCSTCMFFALEWVPDAANATQTSHSRTETRKCYNLLLRLNGKTKEQATSEKLPGLQGYTLIERFTEGVEKSGPSAPETYRNGRGTILQGRGVETFRHVNFDNGRLKLKTGNTWAHTLQAEAAPNVPAPAAWRRVNHPPIIDLSKTSDKVEQDRVNARPQLECDNCIQLAHPARDCKKPLTLDTAPELVEALSSSAELKHRFRKRSNIQQ